MDGPSVTKILLYSPLPVVAPESDHAPSAGRPCSVLTAKPPGLNIMSATPPAPLPLLATALNIIRSTATVAVHYTKGSKGAVE